MRILQLVYSLDIGGLEQVVVNLCRGLDQGDVDCFVGCLSHPGPKFEETKPKGYWIGGLQNKRPRFLDLTTLWKLCRYLRRERIDLIHSHNPMAHLYGSVASMVTGIPQIQTVHGRGSPMARNHQRRAWLRRTLTHLTQKMVAVSLDVERKLIDVDRLPPSKILTILNGIDTETIRPVDPITKRQLRRERGIPDEALVIGSVGRLAPEKNYPLLVEAVAKVLQQAPTVYLLLVGDGIERTIIEKAVATYQVNHRCLLAGVQAQPSLWLQCCDLFCLSSNTEGTSISLLEAMACGVPVVVTDVGGNREIVQPPTCGLIVPARDPQALAKVSLELLRDPLRRKQMGVVGRQRVIQNFSVEIMTQNYARLYDELLSRKLA